MNRRLFLSLSAQATLGLLAGTSLYSLFSRRLCRINRQHVCVRGLPRAFEGLRVALLSDFHHGPHVPLEMVTKSVSLANSLRPDLIALTGDFVHRGKAWVAPCFRELAKLRAPLGVFGVLGNHDHYAGAAKISHEVMAAVGIRNLTNTGVNLRRSGDVLRVGGVGDLWNDEQRLDLALGKEGNPALLLSHNPDFTQQIRDERVGLVLSGHTHGGQCRLPLIGSPLLPSRYGQRYAVGLCQGPVTQVFVTTGIGHSFPPIRINCPAEVALLTLRSQPTQEA